MRRSRRRGIALADFMAGTMILTGTLTGLFTLTRAKMEAIAAGDRRAVALGAAEAALDRVRTSGLPARPDGDADADGFRLVVAFPVEGPAMRGATGRVEARALRTTGAEAHGLFEARVVVAWPSAPGSPPERVTLGTIAEAPAATGEDGR